MKPSNAKSYNGEGRFSCVKETGKRVHRTRRCVFLLDDNNRTAGIIYCRFGRCKRYKLPEKVAEDGVTYKVTGIEIGAIEYTRVLKHLVIPDSISFVDEDCVHTLPNLRSVHVGKGVDYLNNWHFGFCPKLNVFIVDKDNPYLRLHNNLLLSKDGSILLLNLFSRRNLIVPDGVKRIEKIASWSKDKLETITFPSSLREIGDNSFSNLPKLRKLVLPEGVETLAAQCFMDCFNLESVDLPSTLKRFGCENFNGCRHLHTLIMRSPLVMECHALDIENIPTSCRIFVPGILIDAYRRHPIWSQFVDIQAIEA